MGEGHRDTQATTYKGLVYWFVAGAAAAKKWKESMDDHQKNEREGKGHASLWTTLLRMRMRRTIIDNDNDTDMRRYDRSIYETYCIHNRGGKRAREITSPK